jgi:hypothetical protein
MQLIAWFRVRVPVSSGISAHGAFHLPGDSAANPIGPRCEREIGCRSRQVHRGTVVNLNAIRSISRGLDGRLTLHLKQRRETLAVSSTHALRFKQM